MGRGWCCWPVRPSAGAPQRAVCGAAAGGGERVLGLPADPRRACRTGHQVAPSTVWQILKRAALIGNKRHLMIVLREYEDFCNSHRPHRTLKQAAPLRPLPGGVTDLDHFRIQRRDRAGGVIHEYRLVA
jgi:hypothetical protein